ncbi:MAG: GlsB/YeaQ/YmgE family stress response membrane protein [Janthinobacterium lividum]
MLFDSLHTTNIIAILLIGLVAGWLASLIVGGGGLLRDLVTGLVGAIVGAFIIHAFGIVLPFRDPLVTDIVTATLGAVIVVVVARVVA